MIAGPTDAFDQVAPTKRYRSQEEHDMRDAVERWGHARWPGARCVHELVMDRGKVRADMAFIDQSHFVAIEIKSDVDTTDRLMNQIAMFRLASPELWIVTTSRHLRDTGLVTYLFPSVGVAVARRKTYSGPFELSVHKEPSPFIPHPEAMLSLLWVAELWAECSQARMVQGGKPIAHANLVALMQRLTPAEQLAAVCRQLRGRNALWRADQAIVPEYGAT